MKTAEEWLKEIHHLSDTEIRHGSTVILLEEDIEKILHDGWTLGMEEAAKISEDLAAIYSKRCDRDGQSSQYACERVVTNIEIRLGKI